MNRNKLRYVQLSQERHMIQGANVPGTAVQLQWSGARFRAKEASHRTEGGPNQPRGLGNGERAPLHRSLISNFSLKIAELFAVFFQKFAKFAKFAEILLNFRQV